MGMRSTIAYINKKGEAKCTSVQWCTRIDQNLSLDLASRDSNAAEDTQRVSAMIKELTDKYEHVSSLDRKEAYKEGDSFQHTDMNMAAYGAVEREEGRKDGMMNIPKRGENDEAALGDIINYHIDDGIGVVYDERQPGKVTYFYEGPSGMVTENVSVAKIRAGYGTTEYHSKESKAHFNALLRETKQKTAKAKVKKRAEELKQQLEKEKQSSSTNTSTTTSSNGGNQGGSAGQYHVNPDTGKTGKCEAREKCPFGGDSGHDNHYKTQKEARMAYERTNAAKNLSRLSRTDNFPS